MKNNTTKKTKSQPKKTSKNEKKVIEDLAANILADNDQEETLPEENNGVNVINTANAEEINSMIEGMEDTDPSISTYVGTDYETEKKEEIPQRVVFNQGVTKNTAFIVEKHADEVYNILVKHFGPNNGDFFVGNENTMTQYKDGQRKRLKCIMVTDKHGFNYILWFDMTKLGMIY